MAFSGTFQAPVASRIFTPGGGVTPWWLSGGIAAASCVAAYCPKGAASYAASKINLANPGTYNAADGAAYPTWAAATGWTFDGIGQYLNTGIVNGSGWSMIFRFSGISNTGVLGGSYNSITTRFIINPNNTADNKVYYQNGNYLGVSPVLTTGILCVAGQQGYRNGAIDGGTIGAWSGINPLPIFIGAYNTGAPQQNIAGNILVAAIYSATLTAPQVAALYLAMSNL